jgi:predicted HicB family RNase H-like nuclease
MKDDQPTFKPLRRATAPSATPIVAEPPRAAAEDDFSVQFTTRVPPELRRALNELSAREEQPVSDLLPTLLGEGLDTPINTPAPPVTVPSGDRQVEAYMALITINSEAGTPTAATRSRKTVRTVQLSVRVPLSIRKRVNRKAKEEGLSAQMVVTLLLRRALERRGWRFQ